MSGKALDHEVFFMAFGKRVRELRESRGWSLRDMVVLHGYHASQWQVFERGSNVTLDSVLRMTTVFGMTLTALLGDLGDFPSKYFGQAQGKASAAAVTAKCRAESKPTKIAAKKFQSK